MARLNSGCERCSTAPFGSTRHWSGVCALGLPLGVLLAAILTRGTASQGLSFHVPLTQLVIFTAVAVIAGILAAVLPARRASRLKVLEALQYE